MMRPALDDKAMADVEGKAPLAPDADWDAAFEEFRRALLFAQQRGSINAMRSAVAAYDKFAAVIGAN